MRSPQQIFIGAHRQTLGPVYNLNMFSSKKNTLIICIACALVGLTGCKSKSINSEGEAETQKQPNPLVPVAFGPSFKYSELLTKDYEEMSKAVQLLVNKAHQTTSKEETAGDAEAVEYLGQALKLIFSRPDSDNMVSKLVAEIRRELQGYNSYDDVIAALAREAIVTAQNTNGTLNAQATAIVELENILAEIKPSVQGGNAELRRTVAIVKNADLSISSDVKRDLRMRGMFVIRNPSEIAANILKSLEAKKK